MLVCLKTFLQLKMAKKIKVRVTWQTETPLKMAGIARGTVTAMTGNANFPNPDIVLGNMEKAAARVENAWANRKNGPVAKDELKKSANDLDENLQTQADYVSKIAKEDSTIIHSAGFESTADVSRARVAVQEDPEAPVCTAMSGGVMKVNVKGKANVRNYCFLLVVDAPLNVTIQNGVITVPDGTTALIINSTKHIVTYTGLPALKNVQVAAVYINSAGASGISPVTIASTIV